jgi:hypothetical protein
MMSEHIHFMTFRSTFEALFDSIFIKKTFSATSTGLFTHRRRSASVSIRLGRLKAPTPHSGKLAAAVFASQSPFMPPPTS